MIRSRTFKGAVAALGTMALLSGCAASAPGGDTGTSPDEALADLEPIVLTLSDLDFETGINGIAFGAWMDEVTEKSDGKVTFETFYGSSLIPAAELVSGLSSGLADIGFVSPALAPDQLPTANWLSQVDEATLPEGFPTVVLTGLSSSIERTFEDGPQRAELEDHNLVPLASTSFVPPLGLLCTKPVTTTEEAAGVTVRVGGQPWTKVVSAVGMSPVSLPHSEVYEALQRGVVDCAMTIPSTFLASGILDIGTDLMLIESGAVGGALQAFNKDSWDALPLVVQQILWDAIPTVYVEVAKTTLDQYRELIEVAEEKEIEIVETPELNKILRAYRAELKGELSSLAPASFSDPESFVSEFEKTVADTNAFVNEDLGISNAEGFDELLAAYANGSDGIDWDLYRDHVAEQLARYRPE